MNGLALVGAVAGGVGLFLLGMGLMTEGLKLAAGPALERILARSTQTRLRGLATGIAVTALVQSSSAVTVAAIGFVNAGLLSLSQALWVLFGANVGTTMTGWLVALVGLEFKIEALALPLVGVGMILRLTGARARRGALGMALAGFGVLFLGIDMLKESFSGFPADFRLPGGTSLFEVGTLVLMGAAMTVLMQSSSASLAVALTAAQGGLLTAQGAAAVVIGANIGTTATALIAAIGATGNAKRAATAHILFNVITGVVALALLPFLVTALAALREWFGLAESPAATLALFHTVFNVLGVILVWPLASQLTVFLQDRFRGAEDDLGQPHFLDSTVLAVPALALDALEREVRHLGRLALKAVGAIAVQPDSGGADPASQRQGVVRLNAAIADFIVLLNRSGMSQESAARLPELLRLARYYESAVDFALEASLAMGEIEAAPIATVPATVFRERARVLLEALDPEAPVDAESREAAVQAAQDAYQALKAHWLEGVAQGHIALSRMDPLLRGASALRRALEQATKAARKLNDGRAVPPGSYGRPLQGARAAG